MEYAYIRLLNVAIGLDLKVLIIKLNKEKFINKDFGDLKCILIEHNENITINNIKVIFVANDHEHPCNYSGDQVISDWLIKRNCKFEKFPWSFNFPNLQQEPRVFKI